MLNKNHYKFKKLPDSKIIITNDLCQRLLFLMSRSSLIAGEHICIFYGKEIDKNVFLFYEMDKYEDYDSMGDGSKNLYDYSVESSTGKLAEEIEEKIKTLPEGTIIADIHIHPFNRCIGNGDENGYRYFSSTDIKNNMKWKKLIDKNRLEHIVGLIGVDRDYVNMTLSFVWYNKKASMFYLLDDIFVYNKELNKCDSFSKVYDIKLLYKNFGIDDILLSKDREERIKNLKS